MGNFICFLVIMVTSVVLTACGLIDALTGGVTWDVATYKSTTNDTQCTDEKYSNSTCASEINPFSVKIKLLVTKTTIQDDGAYYTAHEGAEIIVRDSNDKQLYKSTLTWNTNSNKDYGFETTNSGYTCTSIIHGSGGTHGGRYFSAGQYVTTTCTKGQDTCHTCYPVEEKFNEF